MAKIQVLSKALYNSGAIMLHVGVVVFDENGMAEVAELEKAKLAVEQYPELIALVEEPTEKQEEPVVDQTTEETPEDTEEVKKKPRGKAKSE